MRSDDTLPERGGTGPCTSLSTYLSIDRLKRTDVAVQEHVCFINYSVYSSIELDDKKAMKLAVKISEDVLG